MFVCSVRLLAANILVVVTLSSGQICPPASIAPPGGDVPSQGLGDWFVYRQYGDATTNPRVQVKSFGPTVEPNSNTTTANAINQYVQRAWLVNGACQHQFWIGLYNIDGTQTGRDAISTDDYSAIRFRDYSLLYHDYQRLVVGYGCIKPNKDGTCAEPLIYAQTRTRPDQLSTGDMDKFDNVINNALKSACISVQKMPKQLYDDKQQKCPLLEEPPTCIGSLIKGTQLISPTSGQAPEVAQQAQQANTSTSTGSGSYAASTPPTSTCKWPLSINSSQNVKRDPSQVAGLWYVYRTRFEGIPGPINTGMRYFWTIVNEGMIASSNLTGTFAWAEYAVYPPNGTDCQHFYWTGLLAGTAGAGNVGVRFITNGTADGQGIGDSPLVPDSPMTIYQDDKYQFFYGCYLPNLVTGMCDAAFAFFGARTNPADLPQSEKDRVDSEIITPLFREFGCSATDMQLILQPKDMPECAFKGTTPCLDAYIAGYKEQAPQPTKPAYY